MYNDTLASYRTRSKNPPNTVAPVEPAALCVAVQDELIVCEGAAVVVGGGGVRVRRVQRAERLQRLALGQAPARRVRVAETGTALN